MPPPHSLHCTEPTGKCKKKSDTNEGLSSREYRDSAAPNGPTREILRESYKENAERRAPQQPCKKMVGVGIILSTLESRNESHPNQGGS
jgi:hypothetical protein